MKKKSKNDKTIIILLLILAAAVVLACIIVSVIPVKRTTKAQTYDLDCVTKLKKYPLEECKDE